jgi:Nucleotidyl transferase AbiEii toxin, Type IV TA system
MPSTRAWATISRSFEMRLLHFRRTFVEKLFTIHGKVEAFKAAGQQIGVYARHYYDLFCLADRPEILAMLNSQEYMDIRADYDRVSRVLPTPPSPCKALPTMAVARPAGVRSSR